MPRNGTASMISPRIAAWWARSRSRPALATWGRDHRIHRAVHHLPRAIDRSPGLDRPEESCLEAGSRVRGPRRPPAR